MTCIRMILKPDAKYSYQKKSHLDNYQMAFLLIELPKVPLSVAEGLFNEIRFLQIISTLFDTLK